MSESKVETKAPVYFIDTHAMAEAAMAVERAVNESKLETKTKVCKKCHVEKVVTDFYKCNRYYQTTCKLCKRKPKKSAWLLDTLSPEKLARVKTAIGDMNAYIATGGEAGRKLSIRQIATQESISPMTLAYWVREGKL